MPSFGKRVDVPGGRRHNRRQQVTLAGSAIALDGSRSVLIGDVCSTGAKLHGRNLPSEGKQLIMKVGDVDLMCAVVWADGNNCGLTFDTPLDGNALEHLKEEGQIGKVYGIV